MDYLAATHSVKGTMTGSDFKEMTACLVRLKWDKLAGVKTL